VQPKKKQKGDGLAGKSNPLAPSLPTIGLGMTKTVENSKTMKIDPVTFNKLNTGCLVVGYVLQVTHDRLVVSLPGSSTGMVAHHEVSDVLYKMKMTREPGADKVTFCADLRYKPALTFVLVLRSSFPTYRRW
jgi:hypothetical protein